MLCCAVQLLDSTQFTAAQKDRLLQLREAYLCNVAQLAKARAAFEVDVEPNTCCTLYCSASGNEAPVYTISVRRCYATVLPVERALPSVQAVLMSDSWVLQEEQPSSDDPAGCSETAAAGLRRTSTSVCQLGRLLQQEQMQFLRVSCACPSVYFWICACNSHCIVGSKSSYLEHRIKFIASIRRSGRNQHVFRSPARPAACASSTRLSGTSTLCDVKCGA